MLVGHLAAVLHSPSKDISNHATGSGSGRVASMHVSRFVLEGRMRYVFSSIALRVTHDGNSTRARRPAHGKYFPPKAYTPQAFSGATIRLSTSASRTTELGPDPGFPTYVFPLCCLHMWTHSLDYKDKDNLVATSSKDSTVGLSTITESCVKRFVSPLILTGLCSIF